MVTKWAKEIRLEIQYNFPFAYTSFNDSSAETIQSKHKTTRPGSSEKLVIEYEHNFEIQGDHEVDLYVKKLEDTETQEDCEKLTVKDLKLVSICPFQVIFPNG